jgi:hypothetical protein
MSNITLSWNYPSVSGRQRPHAHVLIDARVSDSLPWTNVALVEAPAESLVLEDVAPGEWSYRARLVDVDGRTSEPVFASAAIEFDAPSALVDFHAG